MSKGFPTPDIQSGDATFSCISVYVPDNPEFQGIFASAIYGLYASMSKEYFWRKTGTMSAQDAAFLAARGLAESQAYDGACGEGGTMSCLDVADCIETDATVQNAITETITNNGFIPNPDTDTSATPPPTLSSAAKSENLLPTSLIADCENNPQIAMGLARAIVRELHESAEDFFEAIEYATNTTEAIAMATAQAPIVGKAVSGAFEFVDWVLETMKETYTSSYNQTTEDELSCLIFCHIMDTCSLSIDDLISIYENAGSITVPPIDDIEAVMTFAIELSLSSSLITVSIFHYQILRLISWGSFAGFSAVYLKSVLTTNVSASDYTYEDLCDDCPIIETPTTYWAMHFDFRIAQHNTGIVVVNGANNDGIWDGNGYRANLSSVTSTTNANFGYPDLGAQYIVKGQATRSVRRGSSSNGTHDFANLYLYPNANYGGTATGNYNHNFIALNGNDVTVHAGSAAANPLTRSFVMRTRLNKATNATPTPELRTYEMVVIGLPNAGVKPPRSYWFGDTFPTTAEEYFPT